MAHIQHSHVPREDETVSPHSHSFHFKWERRHLNGIRFDWKFMIDKFIVHTYLRKTQADEFDLLNKNKSKRMNISIGHLTDWLIVPTDNKLQSLSSSNRK